MHSPSQRPARRSDTIFEIVRMEKSVASTSPISCRSNRGLVPCSKRARDDSCASTAPGIAGASLPACPYRSQDEGGFACAAAENASVTADDCLACSIPSALAHDKTCLYLVPLRHRGEPLFACRCYSSDRYLLAAQSWRHLCFCSYWFPRPPSEQAVPRLLETRRCYLRIIERDAGASPVSFPIRGHDADRVDDRNPVLRWVRRARRWWLWN